jgi:chemotaxis protein methyltransferase CheR
MSSRSTKPMQPSLARTDLALPDLAFEELKAFLVSATGNYRLSAKDSPVREKVLGRLRQNGLSSLGEYLELLKDGKVGNRELDSLIAELTVGETFFFRHPDHFDALRDHVLPAVVKRNEQSRQLRIWSAGCANGAEAYSIAILAHSVLGERLAEWNVTIVGSDINRAFLAEAEAGSYSAWTLRGVPQEQIRGFFVRNGALWGVRDKYKQNVRFVYHNLIKDEVPSIHNNIFAFDVVFCRNVMIYFDAPTNGLLAGRIDQALVDDGWLFVGSTDFNPHLDATFAADKQSGAIVYRKRQRPASPVRRMRVVAPADDGGPARQRAVAGGGGDASRRRRPRPAADGGGGPGRVAAQAAQPQGSATALAAIVDLANRGDWQNASRQCQAILAAEPFNAAAHYFHALVLHSTGAIGEAEQALRRAIYLDRAFALAHYQLGLARKEVHDTAGGVRAFRNALDALGNTPDDRAISPCGQITALHLRELATQQLELMSGER